MNKFLLLSLLLSFFAFDVLAQTPRSLSEQYPSVDPNNEWKVLVSPYWPAPLRQIRYYRYSEEQHLINGKWYRNLEYQIEDSIDVIPTRHYARQEGAKVWVLMDNFPEDETLIADFSLSVGDTLYTENEAISALRPLIVFSIDTVLMSDGSERLQFRYICSDFDEEHFTAPSIQGVLNVYTIYQEMFHCSLADDWNAGSIICYYEKGQLIYSNPQYEECTVNAVSESINLKTIQIFPNPGASQFTLSGYAGSEALYFAIYNTSGVMLKSCWNNAGDIVSTADLPSGLYHVQIKNMKGSCISLKWVKM